MWRIWFFFGILKISFAAPVETSQEDIIPSSELAVLKCLLSSPLNTCDDARRSVERIPKRLQKLYEKLKKPLLNATSNEIVDSASLDALPASFLYLIPKVRLSSVSGFTASNIVRRFPFDDALTMKILSVFTDKVNIKNFLNGLAEKDDLAALSDDDVGDDQPLRGIAPISPAVEKEIAHALSRWFSKGSQWEYWLYKASMITGTPVLASLPNYFLNSLSLETTEKFLFHLRNWRWDNWKFYDPTWSQHSMSVKRIWSSIVLGKAEPPSRWTPKILRQFGFFLIGATPDELSQLSSDLKISQDFKLLLDLNWNKLQARVVFDVGFSNTADLTEADLNSVKNLILHLLPRQIQQFSYNATDFSHLKVNSGMSLPTEKQLFNSYIAYLIGKNVTEDVSPQFWIEHMPNAGQYFHLMPASYLEGFQNESLDLDTLTKADSPLLSFRQARYLTKAGKLLDLSRPETVLNFRGLLKSIPSVELAETPSNLVSNLVKEHLLMFGTGESTPFTASVLEKVRGDIAQTSYLEKMLYNKDFIQYFNLLGNRDITEKYKDISLNLFDIVSRNPVLERNVRLLPPNILSALLSVHRREVLKKDGSWNYENLIESPLKLYISGLTCADIEMLEISDFMPVISYYVHQRRAMNEVFPKNMQYCVQNALTEYFKLKASLRGYKNEAFALLNLLEMHEVRAVGGYILAGLPINIIDTLGIKYQIISEIGKLTIPELLTATSLDHVKQFADMYVGFSPDINLQMLNGLGNLVWFLNADKVHKLNVNDFKLHLESLEETAVKALCLNEKERNAWKQLLIRTFGKPDSWSAGTLSYLGDLLFVLDSYELERINKTSRTEIADILSKSTSFYTVLDWPGSPKPVYLFEACLDVLSIPEKITYRTAVKQLLRFYLDSNEYLLSTVSSPQSILKLSQKPNLVENAPVVTEPMPVILTELSNHFVEPENIQAPLNTTNRHSEKDYEYSSEELEEDEEEEEDDEDEDEEDDEDQEEEDEGVDVDSDGADSGVKTTTEVADDAVKALKIQALIRPGKGSKATSPDEGYESDEDPGSQEHGKKSLKKAKAESPDGTGRKKRFDKSLRDSKTGKLLNVPASSAIFASKNAKSFEELKEELQRNASRALIVEVPLNRTDFVNFGSSTTRHVKVSCDAIRMLGRPSSLILDVKDFKNMNDTELEDCSEHLGTLNLDQSVKSYIWSRLKKWKESGNLKEVGDLVSAIEESDLSRLPLKLTEPWAMENLHALSTHITDQDRVLFIADQFLLKNMEIRSLKYEAAVSLGKLVCTMAISHQRKYLLTQPEVFINVAKTLGQSLDCSNAIFDGCLRQLAVIATSENAFGETHKWTANDVSDLGVIVAGLKKSDWENRDGRGLKPEALAGLTPTAVSCIPPDMFKVLTEDQLLKIPPLSAAAISLEQSSSLSPSQYDIIDRVRRQVPPADLTSVPYSSASAPALQTSAYLMLTACLSAYLTRTFLYA